MSRITKILSICLLMMIMSGCRERVREVGTIDIQQLLTTGDAQYAQVNDHLYVKKSILQEENQEVTYPQYRTGIVDKDKTIANIQAYEGIVFQTEASEHHAGVEEVIMRSTIDDCIYSFVSGLNLLQLSKQTDNGDRLRFLAEAVVRNKEVLNDTELQNFDKQAVRVMVNQFIQEVLNIDKANLDLYAITVDKLESQEMVLKQDSEEFGEIAKPDNFTTQFQEGYYVEVTPFIEMLPQFSGDAILSEDDPTTGGRGAMIQLFVTKEGIQSALIVRLVPDTDNQYGEIIVGNYDHRAIEEAITIVQMTLGEEKAYIDNMELIYFPTINRQEKDNGIYFTPIWRFTIRKENNVSYMYLEPETYKEIL